MARRRKCTDLPGLEARALAQGGYFDREDAHAHGIDVLREQGKGVRIPREQIADFCRRHHIRRLSVFGSILRDDFRANGVWPSDVDVLVEFEPGHTPGWEIVDIETALSFLFHGRKVDMVNPKYLNRRLKDRILASAEVQYEAPHAAAEEPSLRTLCITDCHSSLGRANRPPRLPGVNQRSLRAASLGWADA